MSRQLNSRFVRRVLLCAGLAVAACAFLPARSALAVCNTSDTDQTCTNPAGTILTDPGGTWGIQDNNTLNLTNFGTVTGSDYGVQTTGDANIFNAGTISGPAFAGIFSSGIATVTNSGTIDGDSYGIFGDLGVSLINSGTITSASGTGVSSNGDVSVINSGSITGDTGIFAAGVATVTNSGSIIGASVGIEGDSGVNLINSGTISGGFDGVTAGFGTGPINVTNSGTISGNFVGIDAQGSAVTVRNSGTISGGVFGILAGDNNYIVNSGTIFGGLGNAISVLGTNGSVLINSGTISTPGGTAIDFGLSQNDTITLLPGSRIVGAILLGSRGIPDTLNIHTGRDIGWLLTFGGCGCGGGIVSTGAIVNFFGGAPYVLLGDQIATLDPTAFGLADKSLVSFTSFISSLLGNRFGEFGNTGSTAAGAIGFAPAVNGIAAGANDAINGALAYAGDSKMPNAMAYDKSSGIAVWSKGFVGAHYQAADGPNLGASTIAFGGMMGLDKQFTPNLRLGAFVGAGNSKMTVDLDSQKVKTDYVFGGLYGRYAWAAQFLDFAVTGGTSRNASERTVANNIVPGGLETASANYNGWFISPEIAYGVHMPMPGNIVMTPTGRLRYIAGFLGGYSETGSAQNLQVGSRTTQNLEERLEVAFSRTTPLRQGVLKTTATIGLLGQERLAASSINTVLLGQSLSFAPTGTKNAAGALIGLAFDYRITHSTSLFAAVEGTVMSDDSRTGIAQGGVRVSF